MPTPSPTESGPAPSVVRRHQGLLGRTVFVSLLTLLSRVLGFVREMAMAFVFGDGSAISDAFFTAWRVPNLFRRLLGEGALSTSLQTGLTEADAEGGDELGRRLFTRTLFLVSGVLLAVTAASMALVAVLPDRMPVTGWAWFGADPAPVRDLMVRLLPYVILVCVAALFGGALQVRGRFGATMLAPITMNTVWIAAIVAVGLAFASEEGGRFDVQWDMARLLAWGVLLGGLLQLAIHFPSLARAGLLPGGGTGSLLPDARVLAVLKTALPLALGAAVYQINVMIDGLMAEGLLADGGPTALYYANRVQQFPLALAAIAATTSVFPALKAHAHVGELADVRRLHDRTQLGVLFLALPAAGGLLVLAHPIAEALFEHGRFGAAGTARVAAALRMLALAVVPAGAVGLLGRTFIALGDVRTPVRVSAWMLLANVGLNVLLVRALGLDVAGLALATAISSWGNLAWLARALVRRKLLPPGEGDALSRVVRVLGATCGACAAAWAVERWSPGPVGLRLLLCAPAAIGTYFGLARLLRIPEWSALRERLARRKGR